MANGCRSETELRGWETKIGGEPSQGRRGPVVERRGRPKGGKGGRFKRAAGRNVASEER